MTRASSIYYLENLVGVHRIYLTQPMANLKTLGDYIFSRKIELKLLFQCPLAE